MHHKIHVLLEKNKFYVDINIKYLNFILKIKIYQKMINK